MEKFDEEVVSLIVFRFVLSVTALFSCLCLGSYLVISHLKEEQIINVSETGSSSINRPLYMCILNNRRFRFRFKRRHRFLPYSVLPF